MTVSIKPTEQGTIRKISGVWVYLILCRRFPLVALKEIGGALLIFALMVALLLMGGKP